jgi:hypothetical protein
MLLYNETGTLVARGPQTARGQTPVPPQVPAELASRLAAKEAELRQVAAAPLPQGVTSMAAVSRPSVSGTAVAGAHVACDRGAVIAFLDVVNAAQRGLPGYETSEQRIDYQDTLIAQIPVEELRRIALSPPLQEVPGYTNEWDRWLDCRTRNRAAAVLGPQAAPPITSTSPGASGRPFAECQREDKASGMAAKLAALNGAEAVIMLRGAITGADFLIGVYRQCLPDPKAQAIIDGHTRTRASALQTCQQMASAPHTCEVSPF